MSSTINPLNSPLHKPLVNHLEKVEPIKKQLQEVKEITANNIEKVLERGDKIELLVDNSARLQNQSYQFQRSSRRLKNVMVMKKLKLYLFILVIVGLLIYILACLICGNASLKHCK